MFISSAALVACVHVYVNITSRPPAFVNLIRTVLMYDHMECLEDGHHLSFRIFFCAVYVCERLWDGAVFVLKRHLG